MKYINIEWALNAHLNVFYKSYEEPSFVWNLYIFFDIWPTFYTKILKGAGGFQTCDI